MAGWAFCFADLMTHSREGLCDKTGKIWAIAYDQNVCHYRFSLRNSALSYKITLIMKIKTMLPTKTHSITVAHVLSRGNAMLSRE